MQSKKISLGIILLIYIVCLLCGYISCLLFIDIIESPILVMLVADVICTIIIYIFSLLYSNSSVYDPYWSVIPVFIMIGYFPIFQIPFETEYLIVLIPFLFWAIRLTTNWVIGFDNLTWIDWRYKRFQDKYPRMFQLINFSGIMLIPTLLVFAGTIPFYYLITGSTNIILLIVSAVVIVFATTFQFIADLQLKLFKKNNKGGCIDIGLWRYCRHPNYFGEIMIWWGVFIASLSNFKIHLLLGPLLITFLFLFISIPLMENHILETRVQYEEYKRKVRSKLIPFFRRKE